ncbi:glycosyltransferase family 4 protein [Candidatus Roizmanbacteria bacterium]|nr:glycosyltransferase family 4 protein [Candidatus Roizmanbacteria bacterium]
MKIGIDISQIVHDGTGVARFTNGLLLSILEYDKKNEWTFFFSSLRKNLDSSLEQKILSKGHNLIKWKLPPTLLSFLWNDLHRFSSLLPTPYFLLSNFDWFITSDWTEPPLHEVKKMTIVHDLTFLRYPETVNEKIIKTQEKRLQHVKKESKIIFADSHSTKKDLIELLHIEEKRIVVDYPGVEIIRPSTSHIKKTLKKYNLKNKKFILTVGKLEPRKNFERLIHAFKRIEKKDIKLVIVGPKGWQRNNLTIDQSSNITFLGFVPDVELYSLYSSCLLFVYPSIWEGFGYPIIEAMKSRAPVTCSNTSSIKEIADRAALFFDPTNINEMTQCINELSQNKTLRKGLIKKGIETSKIFSWKNYYDKLISSL